MTALMEKTVKLIKNEKVEAKKFPKESIPYLLEALSSADNKMKSEIENKIFHMGRKIIPELVNLLETTKGVQRAVISMILIRFGHNSLESLKSLAKENSKTAWMVDYLVNEILGSQDFLISQKESLAV